MAMTTPGWCYCGGEGQHIYGDTGCVQPYRPTSKTGLPLCPTCGRLESQHTNPVAHQFGEPWKYPQCTACGKRRRSIGDTGVCTRCWLRT